MADEIKPMDAESRKPYLTDLSDEQWVLIAPLLPKEKPGGRPRSVDLREVINTLLYVNRTGCQWSMIPHDLLPKSTVYAYFVDWGNDGTWQRVMDALRRDVREEQAPSGEPEPSAGSIDSQSVKTTESGSADSGYDGGKKIKGRKRHLVVDTLGMVLLVAVTSAALDDARVAPELFSQLDTINHPRLETIWADGKYHNYALYDWLDCHPELQWELSIVSRPPGITGFLLLPKRWVVERTFSWINRCRRNSKDVEKKTSSSEAMIKISQIHLMLKRLRPTKRYPPFKYRVRCQ